MTPIRHFLAALAILSLPLMGQTTAPQLVLSIPATGPIRAGQTVTVQASLQGGAGLSIAALQASLQASTGGTWTALPGSVAVTASKQTACGTTLGIVTCVLYGMNINVLPDGPVALFSLALPTTAASGAVTVTPSVTLAASATGDLVPLTATPLSFNIASPCDINGDGVTNLADALLVVSQIIGASPATFDLDGDGKTTIQDLIRVLIASQLGGTCRVGK